MNNSEENTLLTLYHEKMNYLAECHKVYYWMLALFGTGLIVSAGFIIKDDSNNKLVEIIIAGVPFLIIAWFSAYLFCYWHNNLLCLNIDYIEKIICKKSFEYISFPTWYSDFFKIFMYAGTLRFIKKIYYVNIFFGTIAFSIVVLYGFCIIHTLYHGVIPNMYFFKAYLPFLIILPSLLSIIHWKCGKIKNQQIKKIYEESKLVYDDSIITLIKDNKNCNNKQGK